MSTRQLPQFANLHGIVFVPESLKIAGSRSMDKG